VLPVFRDGNSRVIVKGSELYLVLSWWRVFSAMKENGVGVGDG
jgi:hypothetical protein